MLNNHHTTHQAMYITCLLHLLHVWVATGHLLGQYLKTQTLLS
jgi:hypothetical protein